MKRSSVENRVSVVMELTGITPSALARKLKVTRALVERWRDGHDVAPGSVLAQLDEILERTKVETPLQRPRKERPRVESRVVCEDSVAFLRTLPDESVDMILSDIPYGIGLDDWDVLHANKNSAYMGSSQAQRDAGKVFKKRRKPINGWSAADQEIPREYYQWCSEWAREWFRVLRPGASVMVFAGRRLAHRCMTALEDAGMNVRDTLAWVRPRAVFRAQRLSVVYQKRGDLAEAARWDGWRVGNLRPNFEPILWCFKPYSVTIADNMLDHWVGAINTQRFEELTGSTENVLRFGFAPGESGHHEAQKPLSLLRVLIELCTVENQLVLDPFAGSGSTAVAAAQLSRRFLAVERDEKMCETARERLDLPIQSTIRL